MYAEYVMQEARRASDRKHYSQIMRYLKKLSLYEGGMEVALTVADELKKYYSRKSAMMDELRKVMG